MPSLTHEQIIEHVQRSNHTKVKVAVTDIDGVLRGKLMHRDKWLSAIKKGFGFCDVVFGWDMVDELYPRVDMTGWHTGYPDAQAQLDLTTFREVPWDRNIPFFLADFRESVPVCPRSLLMRIQQRAQQIGFEPIFSQEFEWFNFKETPQTWHDKSGINPDPITPGMFGYSVLRGSQGQEYFHDLFDLMGAFGVPLEGLHTETGPGVYEAAIRYSDILTAADRAVLFKSAAKEIAAKHGIMASFMAKWDEKLPGCSGHVHQSLWRDGQNCFYDANDPFELSPIMRQYIAGQLYCLPQILPMLAPTINSYKRLVEGAWAPTTATWGIDNRTTALRILNGEENATRIETRVVGSDVNPYLAMAACLASGLYGITHELKLDTEAVTGNGYTQKDAVKLPPTLRQAATKMQQSSLARELFGEVFVDHFTTTRLWECSQYDKAVTDWERKRYFEGI